MLDFYRKRGLDFYRKRLRHVIKFVEFCGRQERISKKQDGSLVGRTPSFRGECNQLFIHKLCAFLDYSNHKKFFLFISFASITSAPPLEKSWLRPCLCRNCVTKKTLKLNCFLAKASASRHTKCAVYHRHIHAFSCKTVQKQRYAMFI